MEFDNERVLKLIFPDGVPGINTKAIIYELNRGKYNK